MKSLTRVLVAVALAIWLALPGVGGDGGENGGGTGVWVLPRAQFLTQQLGAVPRASLSQHNLAQDVFMQLSPEIGVAMATFVDSATGVPVALPVNGTIVRLPANLLQAMAAAHVSTASILITDAVQVGYLITIVIVNGKANIFVM